MNSPSDFGCRGNQEQVGYCGTSAYAWHLYTNQVYRIA